MKKQEKCTRNLQELNNVEENKNEFINSDDVAMLLVQLYADYKHYYGKSDNYAKAVAIAIRMLVD